MQRNDVLNACRARKLLGLVCVLNAGRAEQVIAAHHSVRRLVGHGRRAVAGLASIHRLLAETRVQMTNAGGAVLGEVRVQLKCGCVTDGGHAVAADRVATVHQARAATGDASADVARALSARAGARAGSRKKIHMIKSILRKDW